MSFEEQPAVHEGTVLAAIPEVGDLTYEESINYSQRIKRQIVANKMQGGVPRENEDIKIVLEALKAHDSTALSDRKNRIDESTSQSSAEIAQAMVEIVKQQANKNPFASRSEDGSPVAAGNESSPRAILPKLDESKLGHHDLVEGEGEIGVIQETSETFFNRMGMGKKEE